TIGSLDAGRPSPAGTLTFRLTASAEGIYTVTSTATYQRGLTPASVISTQVVAYGVTPAPVVGAPIQAGATQVSGTSGEADGTTPAGALVQVYVDGALVGAATVTGTTWTIALGPLFAGQVVTAVATAAPFLPSPPSAGQVVLAKTAAPSVDAPLVEGETAVSGSAAEPATIEVLVNGVVVGTVPGGSRWALAGIAALRAGDVVTARATASGKTASDL